MLLNTRVSNYTADWQSIRLLETYYLRSPHAGRRVVAVDVADEPDRDGNVQVMYATETDVEFMTVKSWDLFSGSPVEYAR